MLFNMSEVYMQLHEWLNFISIIFVKFLHVHGAEKLDILDYIIYPVKKDI